MATSQTWTVVFDDKVVIKNTGAEKGTGYVIDDDAFWSQSKYSDIWAIQYGTTPTSDEVEHRDKNIPHCSFADANLGAFQDFITKWDSVHLAILQSNWDNSNVDGETEAEKISRLGARPTSYSS